MAQLVKLEPGDILILANLGPHSMDPAEWEGTSSRLTWLKETLGLGTILLFAGDVDLSVLPAGWTPDAVARM
jgi:hypothetical protein